LGAAKVSARGGTLVATPAISTGADVVDWTEKGVGEGEGGNSFGVAVASKSELADTRLMHPPEVNSRAVMMSINNHFLRADIWERLVVFMGCWRPHPLDRAAAWHLTS